MRSSRNLPVAVLAVLALAAGSCSRGEATVLELDEVRSGEVVEVVSAAARTAAVRSADVIALTGGEVVELLVEDGAEVEAGQVVARLSRDGLELRLAEVDAGIAAARAAIGDARAAIARTDTTEAEDRENILARIEKLLGRARDADDEFEMARLIGERDRLLAERDLRSQLDRQLASARANLAQLTLAREQLRSGEGDLEIVSPIDGTIVLAPATPGAVVAGAVSGAAAGDPIVVGTTLAPNQRIATVHDVSSYVVVADVDELDAVLVEVGQRVVVTVDALPGVELAGRVTEIDLLPVREVTGGAVYPTRVELLGLPSDVRLLLGLTASVDVTVRTVRSDTLVPSFAIVRRGGIDVVYVVRDGVAVEVPVRIVAFGGDDAAVEGALSAGERVIVGGLDGVEAGTPVDAAAEGDGRG